MLPHLAILPDRHGGQEALLAPRLDVQVSYGTETAEAVKVIKRVATDLWAEEPWSEEILEEPDVWGVERLDADGVTIRLVVKTRPLSQWKVVRELRVRIKRAFDAEGIENPPGTAGAQRAGRAPPTGCGSAGAGRHLGFPPMMDR